MYCINDVVIIRKDILLYKCGLISKKMLRPLPIKTKKKQQTTNNDGISTNLYSKSAILKFLAPQLVNIYKIYILRPLFLRPAQKIYYKQSKRLNTNIIQYNFWFTYAYFSNPKYHLSFLAYLQYYFLEFTLSYLYFDICYCDFSLKGIPFRR